MSRQFRYRMAALVAGGLIVGLPLLVNGTASADQLEPGGRRVTFDGGVLGLSCGSKPSVEKLTVPAESTLHVINRTGHDARLELAGKPRGVIPEDGAAEVLFRRGTTPVRLTPSCSGGDDPLPMLVTAVPSTPSTFAGPMPGGSSADSLPSIAAGSSAHSSASGSALPDTRSSHLRPAQTAAGGRHREPRADRRTARARASSSAAAAPHGAINSRIKGRLPGTAAGSDPTFAGMPPGHSKALVPAEGPATGPVAAEPAPPASVTTPAEQVDEPVAAPAAEPVASVRPLRTGRPIGLLGLTAMVCALGVLTAVIRAIVSQRASRTNMA
jgi:hypothetical protein